MNRKILEMRYAIALENTLTKDEILERYLNIAYYGDGAYRCRPRPGTTSTPTPRN